MKGASVLLDKGSAKTVNSLACFDRPAVEKQVNTGRVASHDFHTTGQLVSPQNEKIQKGWGGEGKGSESCTLRASGAVVASAPNGLVTLEETGL